jgi:DNA replication protein DnaC
MTDCPYSECDGSGFVVDTEQRTTRACRCRPARIAERKKNHVLRHIPKKFREVSFDRHPVPLINRRIVNEVRHYVDELDDNLEKGRGLWFAGGVGTGKTTLAMLVSKTALDRGRSVGIYSLPRLLSEVRKTYNDDSEVSYLSLMESLTTVDLLHIDDVGTERSNDWVLEQLYSIINSRYEEERSVVLTTNLAHEQLEDQINERTVSRLIEMCGDPLVLDGGDARREFKIPEHLQQPVGNAPLRYGQLPS